MIAYDGIDERPTITLLGVRRSLLRLGEAFAVLALLLVVSELSPIVARFVPSADQAVDVWWWLAGLANLESFFLGVPWPTLLMTAIATVGTALAYERELLVTATVVEPDPIGHGWRAAIVAATAAPLLWMLADGLSAIDFALEVGAAWSPRSVQALLLVVGPALFLWFVIWRCVDDWENRAWGMVAIAAAATLFVWQPQGQLRPAQALGLALVVLVLFARVGTPLALAIVGAVLVFAAATGLLDSGLLRWDNALIVGDDALAIALFVAAGAVLVRCRLLFSLSTGVFGLVGQWRGGITATAIVAEAIAGYRGPSDRACRRWPPILRAG